jgi:hypothetical protein
MLYIILGEFKMRAANLRALILIAVFSAAITGSTLGKTIFVDDDAAGANNGTNWADAYVHLQDALADANSTEKPVEIRVAQGIYKPDQGANRTAGDRTATFRLVNGVTLKGGYAGAGAPDPNARDVNAYETILSGDLNGDDKPNFTNKRENSYHVVTCISADETTLLDGFTIRGGNANIRPSPTSIGGGILNRDSDPTIVFCTFIGNSAISGGGMYNWEGSNATLICCMFTDNTVSGFGAAIYNNASSPNLLDCILIGNFATMDGGGMRNRSDSNPMLTNCTIVNNLTTIDGGGIANMSDSNAALANCIFWGNEDSGGLDESAQIHNDYGVPKINYCCIQNWTGAFGGVGNMDLDSCFFDAEANDFHLKSQAGRWDPKKQAWVVDDVTSPCIDAGDPSSPIGHEPFPNGGRINMGAYGGTAEASKSYFGKPPCETIIAGDINGDCKIDFADFAILTSHWLQENINNIGFYE